MPAPKVRDYFAEMYVAGLLADAGWNVYFPRRDMGFDLIATHGVSGNILIRPIQVKGKYPEAGARDRPTYGYRGDLSLVHDGMALALVFFDTGATGKAPRHVAWMPWSKIRKSTSGQYVCKPAQRLATSVQPRRDSKIYFDELGLGAMANPLWGTVPEAGQVALS